MIQNTLFLVIEQIIGSLYCYKIINAEDTEAQSAMIDPEDNELSDEHSVRNKLHNLEKFKTMTLPVKLSR